MCIRDSSLLNSLLHPSTYTPSPSPRQYCKEYVCRFVCLLVYLQKPHGRTLPNFLCMSTVVVARASSGGVAIRYVFPVLWMTPCFHTWCVVRIRARAYNSRKYCRNCYQILLIDKDQQIHIVDCTLGTHSAICNFLVHKADLLPQTTCWQQHMLDACVQKISCTRHK